MIDYTSEVKAIRSIKKILKKNIKQSMKKEEVDRLLTLISDKNRLLYLISDEGNKYKKIIYDYTILPSDKVLEELRDVIACRILIIANAYMDNIFNNEEFDRLEYDLSYLYSCIVSLLEYMDIHIIHYKKDKDYTSYKEGLEYVYYSLIDTIYGEDSPTSAFKDFIKVEEVLEAIIGDDDIDSLKSYRKEREDVQE